MSEHIEGAEPATEATRTVPLLMFPLFEDDDGRQEGVALAVRVCANPDCSCTHLFLTGRAFERARGGERIERAPEFDLTYDVAEHAVSGFRRPRTAAEAGLKKALEGALRRKETKALLRRQFELARAALEPRPDPSYDFSPHADGTLAAYLEVYRTTDHLEFTHEGVEYLLDDAWCVRPECMCGDGVVDIHRVDPDPTSEHGETVTKVGAFSFPGRGRVSGAPAVGAELVLRALEADRDRQLVIRRDRLRAEAARRWPAPRAAKPHVTHSIIEAVRRTAVEPIGAKVGRNERCLCGSGKKFKHCCLRAASARLVDRRE